MRLAREKRSIVFVAFFATSAAACSLLVSTSGLSDGVDPSTADGMALGDTSSLAADVSTDVVIANTDGSSGSSGSSGNIDAGSDATPTARCPSLNRGPVMLDTGRFCIDTTEVTQSQYEAFLGSGIVIPQPSTCSGNNSFIPDPAGGCAGTYSPSTMQTKPVVCVDWCDALAFCTWAGKRLCGAIGGGGVPANSVLDPAVSEWMAACTRDGLQQYPYGNTFNATSCNGPEHGTAGTLPVASLTTCEGGYKGLFDMAGNITELDNSCTVSAGVTSCARRGGSYDQSSNAKCSFQLSGPLDYHTNFVGFRCCAD